MLVLLLTPSIVLGVGHGVRLPPAASGGSPLPSSDSVLNRLASRPSPIPTPHQPATAPPRPPVRCLHGRPGVEPHSDPRNSPPHGHTHPRSTISTTGSWGCRQELHLSVHEAGKQAAGVAVIPRHPNAPSATERDATSTSKPGRRRLMLWVKDTMFGTWFLVYLGAAVSIIPPPAHAA